MAQKVAYAAIFMDVQMPRLDGLEATRQIREIPGCRETPIIAMTANAFAEDKANCVAAGMSDFLPKPFFPDQLFAILLSGLRATAVDSAMHPATAAAIPDNLRAISGLDVVQGLRRVNGNMATYQRLLRLFAAENDKSIALLRQLISQEDLSDAGRLAHKLKGSSAMLGATDLQTIAARLEAAIADESDTATITHLTNALAISLLHLTTEIRAALPDETATPDWMEVDWTLVRQVVMELEALLADDNTAANQLIGDHPALLKSAFGPLGVEVEHQITHFLYPQAMQTLCRAKQNTPQLATQ